MRRSRWICGLALLAAAVIAGCWVKDIDTPYYTQITSYYCGSASAEMILNSQKLGIFVSSQDTLYNYIHSHNTCPTGWYSDAGGLAAVLNSYGNSHTPPAYFISYAPASQDDGIKKLTYTIDEYGVPPAAMVYGCAHWVVVRGAITDVEPITSSSYTISGFYVNDPWYGGDSLGQNKYVDISSWRSDLFTGCSWCGASGTTYISVVDPKPVPKVTVRYPPVKPRRPQVIPPQEAGSAAREYLEQLARAPEAKDRQVAEGVRVMRAAQPAAPLLVRRTDRDADAYYIVPLQQGKETSGAVLIDAYSGQLKEATYTIRPVSYGGHLDVERARTRFLHELPRLKARPELMRQLQLKPPLGRAPAAAEAQRPAAELRTFEELGITAREVEITRLEPVWEPSAQSQNPYYPLWRVEGKVRNAPRPQLLGFLSAKDEVVHELTPVRSLQQKGGGR